MSQQNCFGVNILFDPRVSMMRSLRSGVPFLQTANYFNQLNTTLGNAFANHVIPVVLALIVEKFRLGNEWHLVLHLFCSCAQPTSIRYVNQLSRGCNGLNTEVLIYARRSRIQLEIRATLHSRICARTGIIHRIPRKCQWIEKTKL